MSIHDPCQSTLPRTDPDVFIPVLKQRVHRVTFVHTGIRDKKVFAYGIPAKAVDPCSDPDIAPIVFQKCLDVVTTNGIATAARIIVLETVGLRDVFVQPKVRADIDIIVPGHQYRTHRLVRQFPFGKMADPPRLLVQYIQSELSSYP